MEVIEKIRIILKDGNVEKLQKYSKNTVSNIFVEILQKDLTNFSYDKDID